MLTRKISLCLFAGALSIAGFTSGCTVHAGYYNDPYYHDRHAVDGEVVYYNQWEHDTHREHADLNKRNKQEQKEYWDWRHQQDHH
jgi:hypothetical protein